MTRLLLLLTAIILFFFSLFDFFLKVRRIECSGSEKLCIKLHDGKFQGMNLYLAKKGISQIFNESDLINDFTIKQTWNGELIVKLLSKEIFYYLKNVEDNCVYGISLEGLVLDRNCQNSWGSTLTVNNLRQDDFVGERIIYTLRLLSNIERVTKVDEAKMYGDYISIKSSDLYYIFPYDGDLKKLAAEVYLIRNQLNEEGQPSRINLMGFCDNGCEFDLRYKNPILRN